MGKIGERMKNGEQDRQALAVTCGNVIVLLPIQMVKKVYAMEQVKGKNENQYLLEGVEYSGYFLYELLKQGKEMVNYAILIQCDDWDYILFVAKVLNVILLDEPCTLPFYMQRPPFSYIETCYPLDTQKIGYQLDLDELLHQHQIIDREAVYGK